MGHAVGKDIFRKLGKKIDGLTVRVPWNQTLYEILKELYTEPEADMVVKMPYGLSSFSRLERITKHNKEALRKILDGLCAKGLVVDVWAKGQYHYMPSPMVVGIFEFTMMRTGGDLNTQKWARLFNDYIHQDGTFFEANFGDHQKVSVMRALPHEEAILPAEYVEVLDYEKAAAVVDSADTFSMGMCSCRHEKAHMGARGCEAPLDTCTAFGRAADYLIRHGFARKVSRSEIHDAVSRSKALGLVLAADNVKRNVSFICHCCGCCCNVLLGVNRFGYSNALVTSNYVAVIEQPACVGCGKCANACPIDAVEMEPFDASNSKKKKRPRIDTRFCLGCGVCALGCEPGAVKLKRRKQRVLYPEDTFERVVLQCLERGTLQNQIFDNPQNINHQLMRGVLGAFLKLPPVKRTLMSDTLRSRFLQSMKSRVARRDAERVTKE